MNILFNTHSTAFQMFGGMEVQMIQTKNHLERLGIDVQNFNMFCDLMDDFDIIHSFGSYSYDTVGLINLAKAKNIPICLSSVYWNSSELNLSGTNFNQKLRGLAAEILRYFGKKFNIPSLNPTNFLLKAADIILPNSELEAKQLIKEFGIEEDKIQVVPNGVETRFMNGKPDLFIKTYNVADFILFTGRIEKKKNVLNLIHACSKSKIPLVIIGRSTSDLNYYNACRENANENVMFLGHIDHDSELLLSAYSAAKVFVLPSWLETPGISALEAGLAGCNVVITNRGATTEYFEDFATYCDPASIKSIQNAIEIAYNKPKNTDLSNHILSKYTWDRVATKTQEAYKHLQINKKS